MPSASDAVLDTEEQVCAGVSLRQINFAGKNITPPFAAACVQVLPGCATPVDQHAVEEIWLIAQGGGQLEYAGGISRVRKGDILCFASGRAHQLRNDQHETLILYSIYWEAPR